MSVTHPRDGDSLSNMCRACRFVRFAVLVSSVSLAAGCGSNRLETGYQYTPLGATPVQRRAYYAGPFSPEARAAMMSEDREGGGSTGPGNHRPGS